MGKSMSTNSHKYNMKQAPGPTVSVSAPRVILHSYPFCPAISKGPAGTLLLIIGEDKLLYAAYRRRKGVGNCPPDHLSK